MSEFVKYDILKTVLPKTQNLEQQTQEILQAVQQSMILPREDITRWMDCFDDEDIEQLRTEIGKAQSPQDIRDLLHEWHESALVALYGPHPPDIV